jgi:hypothetical protein
VRVWLCSKIAALDSKLAFQHWKPVTAANMGYGYVCFPFPDWQGSLPHVGQETTNLFRGISPQSASSPFKSMHVNVLGLTCLSCVCLIVGGSSQRWPADPTWMPLLASTNPLPEYPSYHSAAGRRHNPGTPSLDFQLWQGHVQV